MSVLKGKKILLAVTGSIAAYKTPHLVRLLVKQGAEVKVITTAAAATLVSPLALQTVSKNPVLQSISEDSQWNNHVALAYWADLILIAPLSANSMAQLAQGQCNNLLHAVYLSAKSPVVFAPAMDTDMWQHPAVVHNFEILKARKNHFYIPVASGELASGLIGEGRMEEPENIVAWLEQFFSTSKKEVTSRRKALVTAGPTYELLDPVRFIGNFSTGKMGIALAEALVEQGFEVTLICGPNVGAFPENIFIQRINVVSAMEMKQEVEKIFPYCSIAVMAAAVADFRPANIAEQKIKKGAATTMDIQLVKNPDILKGLGQQKKEGQIVVGFALETEGELTHAKAKLQQKNADYIALNSLRQAGAGFGTDTNKITLLAKDGSIQDFDLDTKAVIAKKMINFILKKENLIHE